MLEERPVWALKKCEELAIAAIDTTTNYGYEAAVELLDKGYIAAKFAEKSSEWSIKVRQIMTDNKRKRNLIPLLQKLLSVHS